jgi:hypothetical protein
VARGEAAIVMTVGEPPALPLTLSSATLR